MTKRNGHRTVFGMLLCCSLSILFAGPGTAEQPFVQFLDSLRDNRYYDMADQYLTRLEQDPQVPADFKQRLPYERAVTLIQGSTAIVNYEVRGKQLDSAEQLIKQFVKNNANHPLKTKANTQLGNLLQLRASSNVKRANSPSQENRKAEYLKTARGQYEESHKVFLVSKVAVKKKLEGFAKAALDPKTQAKEIATRNELRKDYLQLQLLGALILEETADTVSAGSADYKKYLTDAAKQFDEIYTKYRTLNAGIYSRAYQGRCHKKLGQLKEALGFFNEILGQPDNPAFRDVKTTALLLSMECWLDESQKKYSVAVERGEQWVEGMRPNERSQPDWLNLRLLLSEAYLLYADELAAQNTRDPQVRRSQNAARKLAKDVARFPGDYQDQARQLLARLPGGDTTDDQGKLPTNFVEAKDAAKEAIDEWQTAKLVLQEVPARLRQEKDEEVKKQLQNQLAAAEKKVANSLQEAIAHYRLALGFVDAETVDGDVQTVYYYMAFCYYQLKEFYDAAMLGEFLARRFPDSSGATQGAKIALTSYHQLLVLRPVGERQFENARLSSIASFMVENWPDAPETIDARVKLIPELLKSGDMEGALNYVKQLPEKHPSRADMELRVGREIWRQYRLESKKYRTLQEQTPDSAELATLKQELTDSRDLAAEYLNQGINRLGKQVSPSAALALSVLALSQYHVESGNAEKALVQIEAPQVGLLALADPNGGGTALFGSEAMFRRFAQDAYMLALRAYIGTLPTAKDPDQNIEAAKKVMASLKNLVGTSAAGNQQLVAIYYTLARDLESQLSLSKTLAEKKTLAKGFETFLEEVGRTSKEFNIKNWVAETLYSLGKGFDTDRKKLTTEASQYYGKSVKTYEEIVSKGKSDPKFLHADATQSQRIASSLKLRLAKTNRQLRDYKRAVELFQQILAVKSTMLDVQMEAARTYQLWGDDPGSSLSSSKRGQQYLNAIGGSHPDAKTKRNTVWGWSQLAKVTGRYPKFQEQFHEAKYNVAFCRYKYALRKSKSADRKKYMKYAKLEVLNTQSVYPDMGGKTWHGRYNSLMLKIQSSLGEKKTGLPKPKTTPKAKT